MKAKSVIRQPSVLSDGGVISKTRLGAADVVTFADLSQRVRCLLVAEGQVPRWVLPPSPTPPMPPTQHLPASRRTACRCRGCVGSTSSPAVVVRLLRLSGVSHRPKFELIRARGTGLARSLGSHRASAGGIRVERLLHAGEAPGSHACTQRAGLRHRVPQPRRQAARCRRPPLSRDACAHVTAALQNLDRSGAI